MSSYEVDETDEQRKSDPSGVAALITPWNAPLMPATWKIGPALAAGDTVVLRPAEWTPLSASHFAGLTAEAGLPPGVFNVVRDSAPRRVRRSWRAPTSA